MYDLTVTTSGSDTTYAGKVHFMFNNREWTLQLNVGSLTVAIAATSPMRADCTITVKAASTAESCQGIPFPAAAGATQFSCWTGRVR